MYNKKEFYKITSKTVIENTFLESSFLRFEFQKDFRKYLKRIVTYEYISR